MKPKLLVIELWGVGDFILAIPFLRAATEKYAVTVLAKPHGQDLARELRLDVRVLPFIPPWTALHGKYRLHTWNWNELIALRSMLRQERFDAGVSARWDPRDHVLLWISGTPVRVGFPRSRSGFLLTTALACPNATAHRCEYWERVGQSLGVPLPKRHVLPGSEPGSEGYVLVHSGAAQPTRVWPLDRFHALVSLLRKGGLTVRVAADARQRQWWVDAGEQELTVPGPISELVHLIRGSRLFVGNDSGPGHIAAAFGVPTFTIFGPVPPAVFLPLHPRAQWIEGKPCPDKPCWDYCRFPEPTCITGLTVDEVWTRVERFVSSELR